jgi:tRNA-dihydrouridine synthase
MALRQFELAASLKGEKLACLEARKHFAWYLHGVPHAGRFKAQAVNVETLADIHRLIRQIKRELR